MYRTPPNFFSGSCADRLERRAYRPTAYQVTWLDSETHHDYSLDSGVVSLLYQRRVQLTIVQAAVESEDEPQGWETLTKASTDRRIAACRVELGVDTMVSLSHSSTGSVLSPLRLQRNLYPTSQSNWRVGTGIHLWNVMPSSTEKQGGAPYGTTL